jgi:predicted methyltransferase
VSASDHPPAKTPRLTERAHQLIATRLRPGDVVIDATVGNGYDTLFLAEKVGPTGRVFGFDIQAEAIAATESKLAAAGSVDRVTLFQDCHSALGKRIIEPVRAVMFNLGYLPGGDKACVTQAATTLIAMQGALSRLMPGGLMTVIVYPGHSGGDVEAEQVEEWAKTLDTEICNVGIYRPAGLVATAPRLVVVERCILE